ncbi:MAG TPA: LytTR family DNA-binding domain-containing protein [Sphingomicrobium sp.]
MSRPLRLQTRPWLFILVVICAALALALLNTLQAGVDLAYRGQWVPWTGLLKAQTVEWLDYALFVFPLWMIVRRWPIDGSSWRSRIPLYVVLGVAVAFLKETIYVLVGNYFRPGVFDLETILSEDFSTELLISWSLIGLVHAAAYYRWWRESRPRSDEVAVTGNTISQVPVRGRNGNIMLPVGEIEVITSEGNYARLETQAGSYLIRHTLSGFEGRLDKRFLRIHRRTIINVDHITGFERRGRGEYKIQMRSGAELISARSFNSQVRAALR